jgi:hypothetical protein
MKKTKKKPQKKVKIITKIIKKKVNPKKSLKTVKSVDVKKKQKKKVILEVTVKKNPIHSVEVPRNIEYSLEEQTSNSKNSFDDILDGDSTKKKRRGRNKKEKIYFSKKTEEAIVEYNAQEDMDKRNEIYESKIKHSFEKLVENIFNTFKFTYFDNSPLEIQKETVSHLVSNIHKFQAGKGKAFSYFSIVAKNYLIFHNNNNYKRFNQHVDISDTPSEDSVCLQTEDAHHKEVQTNEFMKLVVNYWEKNVTKVFTKVKDLNIAYAVIELFRNCDRIENFNKKTLYLYIRELSNCKTQQITKVINKMKSYQNVIVQNYIKNGIV